MIVAFVLALSVLTPVLILAFCREVYFDMPRRLAVLAAAAVLGPIAGIVLFRIIVEAQRHPVGEAAIGWDFAAIVLGGAIGWTGAWILTTALFVATDGGIRQPRTLHERMFGSNSHATHQGSVSSASRGRIVEPKPDSISRQQTTHVRRRDPFEYSDYTLIELLDAAAHINRSRYPERAQALSEEIDRRRKSAAGNAPTA